MIDQFMRHSESDPHNKVAWHYQIRWEFSTSKDFYHEFYASKQYIAKRWLGVIWTPLYYVKGMSWHGPVIPKHEHRSLSDRPIWRIWDFIWVRGGRFLWYFEIADGNSFSRRKPLNGRYLQVIWQCKAVDYPFQTVHRNTYLLCCHAYCLRNTFVKWKVSLCQENTATTNWKTIFQRPV